MRFSDLAASQQLARSTLLLAAWCLGLLAPLAGRAQVPKEQIKAALVFNFLKFTEWPSDAAGGPLTLCVAGADQRTEAAFAQVQGRTIENRIVQVRTIRSSELGQCHLLYIHEGGARDLLPHVAASKPDVLTVGDQENFTEAGGVIGLVEQNGRMQFKVNLDMLKRGNYKVSSQLLKLAVNMR